MTAPIDNRSTQTYQDCRTAIDAEGCELIGRISTVGAIAAAAYALPATAVSLGTAACIAGTTASTLKCIARNRDAISHNRLDTPAGAASGGGAAPPSRDEMIRRCGAGKESE